MIGLLILGAALLAAPAPRPQQPGEAEAAALAEYNGQRAKVPNTADAHWKLGLWAEQKGLKAEATSEFLAVTRLEPARDAAWRKLGLLKQDGRWVSPEQVAADKLEAETQRKADAKWLPILRKAKATLAQKGRRAEAEAALAEVKDSRSIPSIWKVFGQGTADDQERAIDLLGHIEGERASRALAGLAVFGKTDLVRKSAVETLTRRNPDDVLMLWVGLLQKPIKYEVRQVAGPGSPGVLTVEGAKFNVRRSYSPPSMSQTQALFVDNPAAYRFQLPLQLNSSPPGPPPGSRPVGWNKEHGGLFIFDHSWAPPPAPKPKPDPSVPYQSFEKSQLQAQIDRDFEISETAKMADGAQAQLQQDVDAIEAGNATTRELNARLAEALRRVSGKDFGDDKEAWLKWSMERRGYQYIPPAERPRSTVDVQVPLPYVPQAGPPVVTGGGAGGGTGAPWCMIWEHEKKAHSEWTRISKCFAAGTPVLTPEGPRPIEALRPGDRVLTADGPDRPPRPGPIRAVHRSNADRTLGLSIGGEVTVTTEGHPLWKVDKGWTRAGDLRAGDAVATRAGRATLEAIEARSGAEVWNLEVDDGATYLVGRSGLVAHDLGPIAERLDDR